MWWSARVKAKQRQAIRRLHARSRRRDRQALTDCTRASQGGLVARLRTAAVVPCWMRMAKMGWRVGRVGRGRLFC